MPTSLAQSHPDIHELLKAQVRMPGGFSAPRVLEEPRGTSPKLLAAAFAYALGFGVAVRGWGAIRDLPALRGLSVLSRREKMRPYLGLARAQLEEVFAALAGFDDRKRLSAGSARACLMLAGVELAARDQGSHRALTRSPQPSDVHELQALYQRVPWPSLKPVDQAMLGVELPGGAQLLGRAHLDLLFDGTWVELRTSRSCALRLEHLRELVAAAVLANRVVGSDDDPPPIERLGVYFSRAGSLRTLALDACMHPCDQHDLAALMLHSLEPAQREAC